MPLTLQQSGVEISIKKVGGRDEARKRLEKMGFVTGSAVTVVSELDGGLIVKVKDSRVALSREMASKILV
ncbi:MAG: ferrous iron transport protein A [Spirochaetaceae bacterium]|jgi:ferrous iron transport protein A|nr:ferrous iron transport protein A [Spirochaetaceae bacterium]